MFLSHPTQAPTPTPTLTLTLTLNLTLVLALSLNLTLTLALTLSPTLSYQHPNNDCYYTHVLVCPGPLVELAYRQDREKQNKTRQHTRQDEMTQHNTREQSTCLRKQICF